VALFTSKNIHPAHGLIPGAIILAAILTVSWFSNTSLLTALLILAGALFFLWTYFFMSNPSGLRSAAKNAPAQLDTTGIRETALEDFTDSLPRAIAVLDRSTRVVHANEAAEALLSNEMVGHPIGTYLQTSSIRREIDRALQGKPTETISVHLLQPTERYIDVDLSRVVSLRHNGTDMPLIFAVLADRTRETTERELRADFLANASHELKTPIASMKGYIETLQGHAKDDPVAREKFLGIMADQAERMERLVTDLLSLRRIESSEHIAPSETADLRKAIEAGRDALEVLADTKDIRLEINLSDSPTAPIFGKTDECVQLFLNLMENAIKLSPKGKTVQVSLESLPNWSGEAFSKPRDVAEGFRRIVNLAPSPNPVWRVIITDQGPGFSQTHLPRIGERFYRIAGDLPAQEKGTGLGLAIVKHIVLRHRAGLFVKTHHMSNRKPNSPTGTSFSVIFPAFVPDLQAETT